MTEYLFGPNEIALWGEALDRKPPEISEQEWAETTRPQIDSFRPHATNAGLLLRFRTRDHGDFDFDINAVAARHLAACIILMGQEAGWLDASANVISPPRPPLDA